MSGEPAGGTNLLSPNVIKSELRTIRGKGGISHDTVYEYGWALLRLPCVTHELHRSGLAELGRPEAAIRAVTCAVYKALPNPQHQLFLQHTLLRADPAIARDYEALKRELAITFADDRRAYTEGKAGFIRAAIREGKRRAGTGA